jgi:hypothetical protein
LRLRGWTEAGAVERRRRDIVQRERVAMARGDWVADQRVGMEWEVYDIMMCAGV